MYDHKIQFEYWRSGQNGDLYFRIRAANGEIIAQSEGYKNRGDLLSTIALLNRGWFGFARWPVINTDAK